MVGAGPCSPAPARRVCVSPRLLEGHDHLGHQDCILEQANGGITEHHVNDLSSPLWVRACRGVRHRNPFSRNGEPELAIPRRGEGTGGSGRRDAGVLTRRDVPARVPASMLATADASTVISNVVPPRPATLPLHTSVPSLKKMEQIAGLARLLYKEGEHAYGATESTAGTDARRA
jgi:hypothetical protein